VKIGLALGLLNPKAWLDVLHEAEELGFESIWLPEHLIFPVDMAGSPYPGQDHPPIPPTTPLFDVFGYLSYFAAQSRRIRLGTNVYLLALRHPFVAARAIQTLDLLSGGRAEIGIGAGWLRSEWTAAGLDPATRGRRLDEALAVCVRLWSEAEVSHSGEFYEFDAVAFEPKPIQRPHPPIHCGGESDAALRRAVRSCDGWLGLAHDFDSVGSPLARLRELREESGRGEQPFEICVGSNPASPSEILRWEAAGVTRLISSPWKSGRTAVDDLRRYAEQIWG
jgi:probable F420-dependent oxidoreductase